MNPENNLGEHYDKLYTGNISAFGEKASGELECGLRYIKRGGKALDIGCGGGRNTAYLALHGFNVQAVDLSRVAIEGINRISRFHNVPVFARVANVVEEGIQDMFKVIVCAHMLHHVRRKRALELVKAMQEHTEVGGLNTIASFTKDGDFFRSNPVSGKCYFESQELLHLYDGWYVKYYTETPGYAIQKEGVRPINVSAYIAAIKP